MPSSTLAIHGGPPVRLSPLPLVRPWLDDTDVAAVAAAVRDAQLIGAGAIGRRVEAELAATLGGGRVLLVNSCTAALEAAVLLSGVGPGDEVILPSFTFVSCANAVMRAGGRPVFAEIAPDTLNIDPASVARLVTPRTRAVMVVHYGGRAADLDALMTLCRQHGLRLIEDAAHGLGATWRGRALGTIGDFGCFSFHGSKDVVCGEGGALVCRDDADADAAEIIREKGTNRSAFFRGEVNKYEWVGLGGSLILSDVLAALLHTQLQRLPTIVSRKRRHAMRLTAGLTSVSADIVLPPAAPESAWHLYPVLVPASCRDEVLAALKAEGIGATFHFVPLHDSPFAQTHLAGRSGTLPVTEDISNRLVRLPLSPSLSDADVDDIITAAHKVLSQVVPAAGAA